MEQKKQETITIKDIYNITERNYDWQSFKYKIPKKYATHSQVKGVDGGVFGTKFNYLDQLQKQKKKIPGPSHYKNDISSRPKSGKMDKKDRLTYSDEVKLKSNKENIPGPGAYFKRPQTAMPYQVQNSQKQQTLEKKDHYLNEVQYLAFSAPGVGEYNVLTHKHVSTPKLMMKAGKKRIQSKQNKLKFLNTMSVTDGTFAKIQKLSKKKDSNFFGRSKRFATQNKFERKVGPNSYKIDTKWSNQSNVMKKTATMKSTFSKNVYYY